MSDQDSEQYEPACRVARQVTKAKGAILIIYDGTFGDGVVVQVPLEIMPLVPGVLRKLANQIEGRLKNQQERNP